MISEDEGFHSDAIARIFRESFSSATAVQLLWKGRDSFASIFKAVMEAERLICLEFYIFRNDETGSELAEILKAKSRAGVRVCLLYDHFGSIETPHYFWKELKDAGVQIRASRPFKWTAPFLYAHRDHKKLLIIDNRKAFTGGLNIANEYRGLHLRQKGRGWRDTGVMLEGPIVVVLMGIFQKAWRTWGGQEIETGRMEYGMDGALEKNMKGTSSLSSYPSSPPVLHHSNTPSVVPAIPIFVSSARGRRRLRRLLFYSINHARQSILLTTAYFTPSWRMVQTLVDAASRGVQVRLLVPGDSDVPAASYAGKGFYTRLLRAGVEIFTYQGKILHAKTFIFDGCWSIIGSTNLDFQSLRFNDEGNVGILDTGFSREMIRVFEEDLGHSVRITLEDWEKRPLTEKLKELFFSIFRRRL
ncbi:MAG: hypothetical protein HGA78_11220 [Nitrospirales bacterium]|nr:hypothetical protein [Nitrospirales bacterium]